MALGYRAAFEDNLSPQQLDKLKAAWLSKRMIGEIATEWRTTVRTIRNVASRNGWPNHRRSHLGGIEGSVSVHSRRNARVTLPTLQESVKIVIENGIEDVLEGGDIRPEFFRRAFVYTAMIGKFPIEKVAHFCRVPRGVALSDFEVMRRESCALDICRHAWDEARRMVTR